MLILTRRINEKLIINGDIGVEILGVKGNQVRLGIAAPKEITVHREEIQLKIQQQQLLLPSHAAPLAMVC